MGPTVEELNKVLQIKKQIKQSIINKGVEITDTTVFADYPSKIDSIPDRYNDGYGNGYNDGYSNGYDEGSANGGGDPYYETLWNYITSNNTNYSYLFHYYFGTSLNVSKLDTSDVKDMSYMFQGCNKLTTLDLSNFDTSKVTTMDSMFYQCMDLTSLDVSNFDTSNVTTMHYMFSYCTNLTSLDVSNFDTSNVTDMDSMFSQCNKLTSLDVSNFDTSNVTTMDSMFSQCKKLTELNLSNFDTSKVTDMGYMFQYCTSLTSLDMSNCDVSKCTSSSSLSSTFGSNSSSGCIALTDFKAPKNISANISFQYCTALTHDSLMSIINNLATVTSTKTLTLGTTNKAKLTADEIAIATNKGWTVK